jgi:hypothetical protein
MRGTGFIARLTSRTTGVETFVAWAQASVLEHTPYKLEAWLFSSPVAAMRAVRIALGPEINRYSVAVLRAA